MKATPSPTNSRSFPDDWRPFIGGGVLPPGIEIWISDADADPAWDAFLLSTPLGQFQQSSGWGRVKQIEGWKATRFLVTADADLTTGFQVLWKAKLGIRVGYVTKGPIVIDGGGFGMSEALALVKRATRFLGLQAVIVQPPDLAAGTEAVMAAAGFSENGLQSVSTATVCVDLMRPWEVIEHDFSRTVGREIRKSRAAGVHVRFEQADESDRFFALMCESCARQKVAPNPASADSIRALVQAFQPRESCSADAWARLIFAQKDDQVLAGLLLMRFGNRLSIWKKGSAPGGGQVAT